MNFREYLNERRQQFVGFKVIENGHDVGRVIAHDKKEDVWTVKDMDGDEWTFNKSHIKEFDNKTVTVLT